MNARPVILLSFSCLSSRQAGRSDILDAAPCEVASRTKEPSYRGAEPLCHLLRRISNRLQVFIWHEMSEARSFQHICRKSIASYICHWRIISGSKAGASGRYREGSSGALIGSNWNSTVRPLGNRTRVRDTGQAPRLSALSTIVSKLTAKAGGRRKCRSRSRSVPPYSSWTSYTCTQRLGLQSSKIPGSGIILRLGATMTIVIHEVQLGDPNSVRMASAMCAYAIWEGGGKCICLPSVAFSHATRRNGKLL